MNRFFSKLNLNDIKIKAEGNSFPPDADDDHIDGQDTASEASPEVETQAVDTDALPSFFRPTAAKSNETGPANTAAPVIEEAAEPTSTASAIEEADMASFETEEVEDVPVHSNGHSNHEISYEESTALYATTNVMVEERVTEIVSDGFVIGIGDVLKVSVRSRPSAVAA